MRDRYMTMRHRYETILDFGRSGFDPLRRALDKFASRRSVPGTAVPLTWPATDASRAAADVEEAQRSFASLLSVKLPGKEQLQEDLLQAIGALADPGSLPFWRAVLGYTFPRDGFKPRRDELALSALALLVAARQDASALALLLETGRTAADPHTRGVAAQLAVLAHAVIAPGSDDDLEDDEPAFRPPAEVVAVVTELASGKAFEERFFARRALEWAGVAAPVDAPEGVFEFQVSPRHSREIKRVVELRSTQTLSDLVNAVLDALGWDHEHLFAFDFGKDEGLRVDHEAGGLDLPLGALGLVPKTTFDFLYDFGDSHHFDVRLLSISEKAAPKATYPRVTKREGKPPKQYHAW